jgi:hypothetical protein
VKARRKDITRTTEAQLVDNIKADFGEVEWGEVTGLVCIRTEKRGELF